MFWDNFLRFQKKNLEKFALTEESILITEFLILYSKNIELFSIYSDLRALFIERFSKKLLPKSKKPMFVRDDGNWVNLINDAVVTYNNNIQLKLKLKCHLWKQ